jgi:tetratricopeptide (TPR) repeat protein
MKRFRFLIALILLGFATLWVTCQNPALTGAKVYIQQQDWDNARKQLEIAVQQEPRNAEAHYLLGRAYGEQGNYEAMVREFQTSLEISERWESDIESIREEKWVMAFNRGVQAGREEDFQKAADEFKMATIIDPRNPDAFNNLGFAYTNLERLDQALEAYGQVFELQPDNVAARINSGAIYFNRGEFQRAREIFQEALEMEPENKSALTMCALALERLAQERRAGLSAASTKAESLQVHEEVRSFLNQTVAVYNQGIEAHPEDKDFAYNLGVLYAQELKNFQAAVPLFQKVTELDTNDVDGWYNLATAQLALNDLEEAQPSLERVIQLEPDNSIAWYQLGIIYVKRGMKTEGEEAFKRAEELRSEGE